MDNFRGVPGGRIDPVSYTHLVCGFNYRFGKNGEGDTELLKKLCDENGTKLKVDVYKRQRLLLCLHRRSAAE